MNEFKSIVVLDTETTSLPIFDYNTTRITELALLGCEIEHLTQSNRLPRVLHKLVLLFNPLKFVHPTATDVSGLCNILLMNTKPFMKQDVEALRSFIDRLPDPVCIIAHNGNRFDYPILRSALDSVKSKLQDNVYCVDSLLAFQELLAQPENTCELQHPQTKKVKVDPPKNLKPPPKKAADPQPCSNEQRTVEELLDRETVEELFRQENPFADVLSRMDSIDQTARPPAATVQRPVGTVRPPATTVQRPVATVRPPATTVQRPVGTVRPPAATVRPPSATVRPPVTTVRPPAGTVRPPVATVRPPSSTARPPFATARPPAATVRPPFATARPPFATVRPPAATVRPPSATVRPPSATVRPPSATVRPRSSAEDLFSDDFVCTKELEELVDRVTREEEMKKGPKSYKLMDIYQHLFGSVLGGAHRAETDCLALLRCVAECKGFFDWMNENAVVFNNIKPLF